MNDFKKKTVSGGTSARLAFALLLLALALVSSSKSTSTPTAISAVAAAAADQQEEESNTSVLKQKYDVPNLVNWLLTKDGAYFAADLIDWKQYDPSDPKSAYGMFAKTNIKKDTTLMTLPQSALLKAGESTADEGYEPCDVVDQLVEEYKEGKESDYAPYIEYLFGDDSKKGKLPSSWSSKARKLLRQLVGSSEDNSLMPETTFLKSDRYQTYKYHCVGEDAKDRKWFYTLSLEDKQLYQDSYLFMISRSWTDVMIPLYDMINHRNGDYRNVEATSAHNGNPINVYALRDIPAGQELYISYNECQDIDCRDLKYEYMTPHILLDYGFVEVYPRRWPINYDDEGEIMVLEIYQNETTGHKYAVWPFADNDIPLTLEELNWIHAQLTRLRELANTVIVYDEKENKSTTWLEEVHALENKHERGMILDYYEGYKEAFEMAIQYREYSGTGEDDGEDDDDDDDDDKDGYRSLTESTGFAAEGYTNTLVCMNGGGTSRDYDYEVGTSSQYQEIDFTYNKEEDNTCLQLSGWIQACSAFRPHYHEAFVHVPAQYVDSVKRVVFLGGGDNMILHEILKFPELELVVGMELDQQVIRSSFQHLGTLPYFDDDRVQWWFGDATKSLFALPEEYFGSFDLVLVDLQTFVADVLKVTDKLSIMETAMLLMKQDGGVIAKNEDFPDRTNVGFAKYTVDLEYHDVPHICMQSITMGSNSIDFMTATPKYHTGVELLAVDLVGQPNKDTDGDEIDPFHAWYGYRQSIPPSCENSSKTTDSAQNAELKDPIGVMVVIEAENLSKASLAMSDVKTVLSAAIKDLNLSERDISIQEDIDPTVSMFILNEGYITARVYAEKRYIAFDLMLWDSLDRVDAIKSKLVEAVGGTTKDMNTSSFRFVCSGMSGLEQCQKNVITQVAVETQDSICSSVSEPGSALNNLGMENVDSDMRKIAKDLIISLKPATSSSSSNDQTVAVFCDDQKPCPMLRAMEDLASAAGNLVVLPFRACSSFDDMAACQVKVANELRLAVVESKKLDVAVLDTSLPFEMGQIIDKMFSDKVLYGNILEESNLILTPVPAGQSWRTVLLDQFRTDLALFDPAHRADIRFYKEGDFMEWCIFSSGDQHFFRFLSSAVLGLEKSIGWKALVKEVANGIINEIVDFNPPKIFKDRDYDKTRALSQWRSQTPVGHQTFYQMAISPPKTPVEVEERILAEHEPGPWDMRYGGAVVKRAIDKDNYAIVYDGDETEDIVSRSQIRKFSPVDHDPATKFEVGDLIFYNFGYGYLQNGVISKIESDDMYSIYLLNTSGEKVYNVPRDRLIHQFESSDFVESVPPLSTSLLETAFKSALQTTILKDSESLPAMEAFDVGSGVVVTAFWSKGNGILKWDGHLRVDVNIFMENEDIEGRIAFQDDFVGRFEYMNGVARDEHPRGYGRMVNFASEIETTPQWIVNLEA
mmetsp:Transcript_7834/g.19536  ORF Transcript_7834/g.19536 Transcript_7834/m.19536 type:complete len:1438 (-) Transcript_7834:738-5051(-)